MPPQHKDEVRQILYSSENDLNDDNLCNTTVLTPPAPTLQKHLFYGRTTIIEPALFLILVSFISGSAVLQNQILFQTCTVIYKHNDTECQPMLGIIPETKQSKVIETEIQPYVARIIMANSITTSVLPAFLSLFIGPWSDRHGRRPVLIATFSATLIGHLITTILASISTATSVNPWFYIVSSAPLALTGGTCALATMVYCLVSDVTDGANRARRLFIVEGAMGIALLLGNLMSSYVLALTGTIGVFGIATGLDLFALIYLLIFVRESLQLVHERKNSRIREFFKFDLIKDLIRTFVKRRPHFDRGIIWCLVFALVATSFVMQGEQNVFYLFTRNKFNLTLQQFTIFNSASIGIKMIGCGIILVLLRVLFKAPLTVVAILGLVSCFIDSVIRSAAQEFWQLYFAAVMGFMGGINTPMFQSILANLVEATEIGKIYAVISSLQTISPLASAPVYADIYTATLKTYPGAFYMLSAGIYLMCLLLILVMYTMQVLGARAARAQTAANAAESVESQ
ncbi:probable peptidoglycan muropeptide transporter SLC46 isoform X2 [Eurosta solidaginis]|uniref:probable peptidoglycan muropeptide transporter SLC46 isoform X2 n=1 Tax=Eurosta solidaginis TaxID=178769 RepID=UPI00353070E8